MSTHTVSKKDVEAGKSSTGTTNKSLILENKKIDLSFEELVYDAPLALRSKRTKTLLKNVSGYFRNSELTALMGPSGAGKSTLMNVITGFKVCPLKSGKIKVNGIDINLQEFRRQSCYIMQKDELMPHLTVMESMMVAANLKLSQKIPRQEKQATVEEILTMLGLINSKHTRVEMLSGGQRKRMCVAQELVNAPPVMFLDEPTSGLDSQSSHQVVVLLKSLAKQGMTIVCTIHQPAAKLFEIFDSLYLLSGGICIYRGPVKTLLKYFKSQGLTCPPHHNPADFVIDVAAGQYGDVIGPLSECVKAGLCEQQEVSPPRLRSPEGSSSDDLTGDLSKKPEGAAAGCEIQKKKVRIKLKRKRVFAANAWTQFLVLFMRAFKSTLRDMTLTHLRSGTHVVVGLLLGGLFYMMGNDGTYPRENVAFLFFCMLFIRFTALMPTIMTFPLEMNVLEREHLNNWYGLSTYYLAKSAADVPFQIGFPLFFSFVVYFMTGQPNVAWRYFSTLMFMVLNALTAQSGGLVIGAATPLQAAVFLGPVIAIPIMLFSGFFITVEKIPVYFRWIARLSYVRYAFEGAVVSVYGFDRVNIECSDPGKTSLPNVTCPVQGDQVLAAFDMKEANLPLNAGVMTVFFILFRIVCYLILYWRIRA